MTTPNTSDANQWPLRNCRVLARIRPTSSRADPAHGTSVPIHTSLCGRPHQVKRCLARPRPPRDGTRRGTSMGDPLGAPSSGVLLQNRVRVRAVQLHGLCAASIEPRGIRLGQQQIRRGCPIPASPCRAALLAGPTGSRASVPPEIWHPGRSSGGRAHCARRWPRAPSSLPCGGLRAGLDLARTPDRAAVLRSVWHVCGTTWSVSRLRRARQAAHQEKLGGRDRRRSGDLALFRRALCQLSYPTGAARLSLPQRGLRRLAART